MRTRTRKAELSSGRKSTEDRIDGVHSVDGGGSCVGSCTSAESTCSGSSGCSNEGDDGGINEATWFDPVDDFDSQDTISDCPGGVCPVPWASDTSGNDEVEVDRIKTTVNSPSHYTEGEIECIEAIEAQLTPEEYRGYLKGTLAVYMWREKHKNGFEDVLKAQWYMNRLVDLG